MSKLGSVGALNDGVDTAVPGIEMSDINDGDILARTRENVNPNGLFQFVCQLDDGSEEIKSDWVDQEHKKKLTRVWVDGVKSVIISRANARMQEAKERAEEDRAKRIRDEQFSEPVDSAVDTRGIKTAVVVESGTQPAAQPTKVHVGDSSDPSAYVEDQLEIARERLRAAEMAQSDIIREVLTARRDYEKWKTLAAALGSVADDGVQTSGYIQAVGDSRGSPVQGPARSSDGGIRRPDRGRGYDYSPDQAISGGQPAVSWAASDVGNVALRAAE